MYASYDPPTVKASECSSALRDEIVLIIDAMSEEQQKTAINSLLQWLPVEEP